MNRIDVYTGRVISKYEIKDNPQIAYFRTPNCIVEV